VRFLKKHWVSILSSLVAVFVFVLPFVFIILTAVKNQQQASLRDFSWPTEFRLVQNFIDVVSARDYMLLTAYLNSTIITVGGVTLLVIVASMVGYVLQRHVV